MTTETSAGIQLAQALEGELERFAVPGMAVGVVQDGQVVLARGFGLRDVAAGLPATERTLFAIGSTTKAFTATLLAALVGDGLLEWDRPVREYLPRLRLHDPVATDLLTARDLLCHRSGLPRHDIVWYANPELSRREVVEQRLRHLEPNRTFREVWQYNNLMYLIAGYLAGELLGSSWEQGIRERLFTPLGMTGTCFSPQEARSGTDWSRGYRERDGVREEMPPKHFPVCAPAGSIYSCVADLARWVQANLNGGRLDGREVIDPTALRTLQAPAMALGQEARLWPERFGIGYGLGWGLESYRGQRLVHHGGNIDGYSAKVVMAPDAAAGVIVLADHQASLLPDAACYLVMDELLGLTPLPWGERMAELQQSARAGAKEATRRQRAASADTPHAHPEAAYLGEYHHPGYGTLHVTAGEDGLTARLGVLDLGMRHRHFETWDLDLTAVETALTLTFATDPEGEVGSLAVPFEPSVSPIVFRRRPAQELSDPELLATFTGDYLMGQLRARVRLDRDHLTVEVAGGQAVVLEPSGERTFTVRRQPGVRIRFLVTDSRATEIEVHPGGGVYIRQEP
ncbi:serine hydrolase [Nocardia alni]|uniref:serine hydrolase n=1 Tax=Nocardia alni TaxID=2815723 RepID=UPI001C2513F3|nr:serine hydrolase [Nocardia alni]